MSPQLIFGTASFGMDCTEFQDITFITTLLQALKDLSIFRLDTAARYPPLNPGRSEELIGAAKSISSEFSVDTKVFTNTQNDGSGDLGSDAIQNSVRGSLQRLQRPEGINVLYSHRADPQTPVYEQVQAFNEEIARGHCKAWGISNTPPAVVREILHVCEQNGWQKPRCYQGTYNLITRGMETELLPLLREHGIRFNGSQPLAAGFLTGKFVNNEHTGTRFDAQNPLGKMVQNMFGAEELRTAMQEFDVGVKALGLTAMEVALRWMAHHSALADEDGIILGASKAVQVGETVRLIGKGPLDGEACMLVDELWSAVEIIRGAII